MKENAGTPPWQRADWILLIFLFVGFSSLYYATSSGITSSNDGSHYALVRTMIENKTFALRQFDDFAEGNDIAITEDGRLFSDRPPGTALVGVLFYQFGRWFPGTAALLPSRHDPENPLLAFLMMLPAMAGAGTIILLYATTRQLGLDRGAALTSALILGLGTAHWKYSSVLFSHALSSFLVLLSFFLAVLSVRQDWNGWIIYLFLGSVLGFSVLVEYSNALWVILLVIYLLWAVRPATWRSMLIKIIPLIAGGLISAAFLAFYNWTNFGSPLRLSYAYALNYPWAGSFRTTFNYPFFQGLRALLYWGEGDGWCGGPCFNQGIFLLSPIVLLAIPGWIFFYRREKRESLLVLAAFLVYLFLFARHRTSHGFTADGRYLVPYLSMLIIPVAFAFAQIFNLRNKPTIQAVALFISYGLFFLSIRNIYLHIGLSYNYPLDLSQLTPMIAQPGNWEYLISSVFLNLANLPLLWVVEGLFLAIIILPWQLISRNKQAR